MMTIGLITSLLFIAIPLSVQALQYMEIHTPGEVLENTNFLITLTVWHSNITIPNATILWNGYSYYTDGNGQVTLSAPEVNASTYYTIKAIKPGFYNETTWVYVMDYKGAQIDLQVPEQVMEGSTFIARATFLINGTPIHWCHITWDNDTYLTDQNGEVSLVAPMVDDATIYTITASRWGLISTTKNITVLDSIPLQLDLQCPEQIDENSINTVKVFELHSGEPVVNVTIEFANHTYYTDYHGWAHIVAPEVNESSWYTISAEKEGYISDFDYIFVLNWPHLLLDLQVPGNVTENTAFSVKVVEQTTGEPIEDVRIEFNMGTFFTNEFGIAILYAPEVNDSTRYIITAKKIGYIEDAENVWVNNNQAPHSPHNNSPSNFARNVNVYASLSWSCWDPDGDAVTYDIYFGTSTNPPLVLSGSTSRFFNPGVDLHMPGGHMAGMTKYYWKIVATDEHGLPTVGPIWCFKTALAYEHYCVSIFQ